jgi:Fe2+ transport system protein B
MLSMDKVSFESQQAMSPEVHWFLTVVIVILVDCIAATDMATARKVDEVATLIVVFGLWSAFRMAYRIGKVVSDEFPGECDRRSLL